jgi:putative transposase
VVTPAARRKAADFVIQALKLSERRACSLINLSRSVLRYQSCRPDDSGLRERLKALAAQYPRYGYPTLHDMLKTEGLVKNRKRTWRLYCEEGLQVRTKRRKKLSRPRVPMLVPNRPNERWSMDFVSDQLASGRRIRVLNIVDDYSRQCVGQIVDTSIPGGRVARFLQDLGQSRGLPRIVVCDNGPEFTGKALFFWSKQSGVYPRNHADDGVLLGA